MTEKREHNSIRRHPDTGRELSEEESTSITGYNSDPRNLEHL